MVMSSGVYYSNIKRVRSGDGGTRVTVPEEFFKAVLQKALFEVRVDEKWYFAQYEDVKVAKSSGLVKNAKDHFVRFGFLEGRLPHEVKVDEPYYISSYTDVAEAIVSGDIESAQRHFVEVGYREGRMPYIGFSIL